jgi:hypothetical protein
MDKGCLEEKKKKRKGKKVAELFPPNPVIEAGPKGGACILIRWRLAWGGSDWRAGSGPRRAGVGEGSGPPRPRDRLAPGAG